MPFAYGLAVRRLAQFVDRCPCDLNTDELNRFFEWLIDTKGWSTVKLDRNGIRFFHEEVLGRAMPWLTMLKPPKFQTLPDVLTIDEIAQIIQRTRERRGDAQLEPVDDGVFNAVALERFDELSNEH